MGLVDHREDARLSDGGATPEGVGETLEVRMRTDGGEKTGSSTGYRAMKPVNRMMNVRDVNLTGDSGRLRRTADAANTEPYITFIAAGALVIPCTVRSLRGLDGEDFAAYLPARRNPRTGVRRSNHKRSAA